MGVVLLLLLSQLVRECCEGDCSAKGPIIRFILKSMGEKPGDGSVEPSPEA